MDELTTWNDDDEPKGIAKVITKKRKENQEPPKDIFHSLVFEMWEGGVRDLEEIRMETGYTTAYIRALLNSRGYEVSTVKARTDDEIDKICADYLNPAMKVRHVLRNWSISLNTLYDILERKQIPLRKRETSKKAQNTDLAVMMYQGGSALKEIFNESGIAAPDLYVELDNRDIPLRSQGNNNDEVVERAIDMYVNSTATVTQITLQTGVPVARLYKELDKRGIQKRSATTVTENIDKAVDLYQSNTEVAAIQRATSVSTAVLYRELGKRNIPLRHAKAQGGAEPALNLYDKGAKASEIKRITGVGVPELCHLIKKRGGKLRTGLAPIVTPKHLDFAVDEYLHNVDEDTIEIDTFVTRVQLYATLRKREIVIRP